MLSLLFVAVLADEQVNVKSHQGLSKSIISYPYNGKILVP
jgi:hypothetical protein